MPFAGHHRSNENERMTPPRLPLVRGGREGYFQESCSCPLRDTNVRMKIKPALRTSVSEIGFCLVPRVRRRV